MMILSQRRRTSAFYLAEAVVVIAVLVPVVLLLIDLFSLLVASRQNDGVCALTSRAVASGPPKDANFIADSTLNEASRQRFLPTIHAFRLVQPIERDKAGNISVSTEAELKPFILFVGVNRDGFLKVRSRHSCASTFTDISLIPESNN